MLIKNLSSVRCGNGCPACIILTSCFMLSVLSQCLLFHRLAFGSLLPESGDDAGFWTFFLLKLSIAVLCAALVPLFRRKWWILMPSALFGLWIFAELLYYRIIGTMLSPAVILQIGNLEDVGDSIFPFMEKKDLLLVLPTLLMAPVLYFFGTRERRAFSAALLMVAALLLHIGGTFCYHRYHHYGNGALRFNPFSVWGARFWMYPSSVEYASRTSVIHSLVHDAWGLLKMPFETETGELSGMQKRKMARLLNDNDAECHPATPLVIVLFESLESWAVTPDIMPNLCRFAENGNVLWTERIEHQTWFASSGDARMIVNTGLLPAAGTIVCKYYMDNRFPSLAEPYDSALYLTTGNPGIWNDFEMSEAYGIHKYDNFKTDELLFDRVCEEYGNYPYLMAVTMASHVPFMKHKDSSPVRKYRNSDMPDMMMKYLNCVHYTDSCMGEFLRLTETDSLLRTATIVIAGDHTIFNYTNRVKFSEWSGAAGEPFNPLEETYCPLIIRSPRIAERTVIEKPTLQMNIYPTILHLIGCDSTYFWKGFGKNLLDPKAKEPVSAEDAYDISDALIKGDWFKSYPRTGEK